MKSYWAKEQPRQPSFFGAALGTFVGFVFAVVGLVLTLETYVFVQDAVQTTGTVLDIHSRRSGPPDDAIVYRPTIRYLDARGKTHRAEARYWSSFYVFDIGDKLSIRYDPKDHQDVRLDNVFILWALPLGLLLIGLYAFFRSVWIVLTGLWALVIAIFT
ncbi:MAG: DUF3592 domain-containing protein [Pseudomonadota bacterium]